MQGCQVGIVGVVLQSGDYFVLYGVGEQWVWMVDQGDVVGIGQIEVQGFQWFVGVIDGYRDFVGR